MKRKILFSVAILSLLGGLFSMKNFKTEVNSVSESNLIYKLDFSNATNRGANTANVVDKAGDATFIDNGKVTFTQNTIHNLTSLNISSDGYRRNYVEIPGSVLNRDSITITGWFKISSQVKSWSRIIEINANDGKNFFCIMPYAPNYYNGLHINCTVDGVNRAGYDNQDNMLHEGYLSPCEINSPKAGYILPVYDAWVHYAYELTPTEFRYYQNGKLLKSLPGNFKASQFFGDNARIYLGATVYDNTPDFTGSYADFRIYDKPLTSEEIVSEFALNYKDFLTSSYDFEDGLQDSVRGYEALPRGNAKIGFDAEKNSNVLILDGSSVGGATKGRTSIDLPNNTLKGHNSLTFSADVYIDSNTSSYSRIFDASPASAQYLTFGVKWQASGNTYLQFSSNHNSGYEGVYKATEFNKWMNLTITIDNDRAAVYYDGVLVSESDRLNYFNSFLWDVYQGVAIGRTDFWGDNPLTGKIDNIKIYQTVLTEREIMEENNIIKIKDDNEAVNHQKDLLTLDFDGTQGYIELPTYVDDGVQVKWTSSHPDIISTNGAVFFPKNPTEVTLTAELSREKAKATKEFKYTLTSQEINPCIKEPFDYGDISFLPGSYYESLMEVNADYMLSLDKDRLLYNYRRIAGLDVKGARSYGAWISPTSNGAGHFEAHYVEALAKASKTMPNYEVSGETLLDRLSYMLHAWKECQDAFALKYPEEAGYLGAIITDNYTALEEGRTQLIDGTKSWVPWYMHHKTLEALVDVATITPDASLRELGKEMLRKVADWTCNTVNGYDEATKTRVLCTEYGGTGETMFQCYKLFGDKKYYDCGKMFEEPNLMNNTFKGIDTLTNIHANTTIPKFLAAAAQYEATGNEYYKTVCMNAFEMIMTRTYANGSTSRDEHWQEPEHTDLTCNTAETCCSYNMMKLADYLYRWTGDVKYLDYYENVFTNHILSSMIPEEGMKTYFTNYAWGYYKLYHTAENSFWCCTATGLESFSQLASRIYYRDLDHTRVEVSMYYPSVVTLKENVTMSQDNVVTSTESAKFVIHGDLGQYTVALRVPTWTKKVEVLYNGELLKLTPVDGYVCVDKDFKDGDTITVNFSFKFESIKLRGSENQYAIKYGPTLFVCDLGDDRVYDIKAGQTEYGTAYTGDIVDTIVLETGYIKTSTSFEILDDDSIYMYVETANQGTLTFVPFNQIFRNRYGMYFKYPSDPNGAATEKGDPTELNKILETEKNYVESNYTSDSFLEFKNAFNAAKNADLNNLTQDEIDELYDNCFNAIMNLKLKSAEDSTSTPGTSEDVKSGGCGGNILSVSLIASIISISGLGIAVLKKKRTLDE